MKNDLNSKYGSKRKIRSTLGQATVEYILLLAIAVMMASTIYRIMKVVWWGGDDKKGGITQKLKDSLDKLVFPKSDNDQFHQKFKFPK